MRRYLYLVLILISFAPTISCSDTSKSSDISLTLDVTTSAFTPTSTTIPQTGDIQEDGCLVDDSPLVWKDSDSDGWGDCRPATGVFKKSIGCYPGYDFADLDNDEWGDCVLHVQTRIERVENTFSVTQPEYRVTYSYGRADGFTVKCRLTNKGPDNIVAFEIAFRVFDIFGEEMNAYGSTYFTNTVDQPLKSGKSTDCIEPGYQWDLNPYDSGGGADMLNISDGKATVEIVIHKILWEDGSVYDYLSPLESSLWNGVQILPE